MRTAGMLIGCMSIKKKYVNDGRHDHILKAKNMKVPNHEVLVGFGMHGLLFRTGKNSVIVLLMMS